MYGPFCRHNKCLIMFLHQATHVLRGQTVSYLVAGSSTEQGQVHMPQKLSPVQTDKLALTSCGQPTTQGAVLIYDKFVSKWFQRSEHNCIQNQTPKLPPPIPDNLANREQIRGGH